LVNRNTWDWEAGDNITANWSIDIELAATKTITVTLTVMGGTKVVHADGTHKYAKFTIEELGAE